jgi:hypothetical protein
MKTLLKLLPTLFVISISTALAANKFVGRIDGSGSQNNLTTTDPLYVTADGGTTGFPLTKGGKVGVQCVDPVCLASGNDAGLSVICTPQSDGGLGTSTIGEMVATGPTYVFHLAPGDNVLAVANQDGGSPACNLFTNTDYP